MTAPRNEIVQMRYQNPHASEPLFIPVLVLSNTPDEDLARNITANAMLPLMWVKAVSPHDGVAILCGGGASIEDHISDIKALAAAGGKVFAMNAASRWLRGHDVPVAYQVIADAKPETASLVDPLAGEHLFASQVSPKTIKAASTSLRLWHLEIGNVEQYFPPYRMKRGGYVLLGGGASVGNSALCLAFAMGYRELHIYGFDSSHRDGRSHVYDQPMNRLIPCVDVEWGGKVYTASVAMKAQAEKFQITAQALQQEGCKVIVHGEGLLPAMWNTPTKNLTEKQKYQTLWQFDGYRDVSPGADAVPTFLEVAKPDGLVVDFGCGTGRAAVALQAAGLPVFLVDFADNCRDEEAQALPFLEWDLTLPCPVSAPYGLCCDVMEHIPTADVDTVIRNIMGSAERVFFQISTVADQFGAVVHQTLHNTVRPHGWWVDRFAAIGIAIEWQQEGSIASQFYVRNLSDRRN